MNETVNVYSLPIDMKFVTSVQANSIAHVGDLVNSIDYYAPEGTPILAALDGIVIDVKDDSDRGGDDSSFEDDANYIEIEHVNGEVSEYEHLKQGSSKVKVGDHVLAGQMIAEVGNTGWSECPHLHFMVYPKGQEYKTKVIRFLKEQKQSAVKDTETAFRWIVNILESLKIPYQITGGFAARIYGVDRPLADIDIDVQEDRIPDIADKVSEYIIFGPTRYKDDTFDIELMTLEYMGQEIDIAGFGTGKIYSRSIDEWIEDRVDLSLSIQHEVYGKIVPIISKENLIAYKKNIAREVDLEDVRQLGAVE